MPPSKKRQLTELARLYNVQTSYKDIFGKLRHSPPEGLIQVLRALGAPVEKLDDVPQALRERQRSLWSHLVNPVIVTWEGTLFRPKFRIPAKLENQPVRYRLDLENGETLEGNLDAGSGRPLAAAEVDGASYLAFSPKLPLRIPAGYHRLRLDTVGRSVHSRIICAPLKAYGPHRGKRKTWGLFSPLYALWSKEGWGTADFSQLEKVAKWVESLGGDVIGTLPLLAGFLDEPFDPSPYSPVSRLFWNEFYVDVTRSPELELSPEARDLVNSSLFRREVQDLRSTTTVDYRRQMSLKRSVLEKLADTFFVGTSQRRQGFESFLAVKNGLEDYAEFRALMDKHRRAWTEWPDKNRSGTVTSGDYDDGRKRYHLYAQWLAEEQMKTLSENSGTRGPSLYLDFPLGVNRCGYDTWRYREVFALEVSGGAPPDNFFTKGQNWGFPPFHPERLRHSGYDYFIDAVRHHLHYSGLLRVDHVMGLHRLYWVPHGLEADQGVYVRYPSEEFCAILSLESHRNEALVIGENLGTVPTYVNKMMEKHEIRGMYVGQFSVRPDPNGALESIPPLTVASLNTHDTPTFASFWYGHDIDDRVELHLLRPEEAGQERKQRRSLKTALGKFLQKLGLTERENAEAQEILKGWLTNLAAGPAELLLVNLEDLWLETNPQNVPGTSFERANWQRKFRLSIEDFCQAPSVLDTLDAIRHNRNSGG